MVMKQNKSMRMALAVAFTALGAVGAAQAQSLPKQLVDVTRKAVVTNPEIQARWREFTASGFEQDFARSGYKPQVDVIGSTGKEWLDRPDIGSRDFTRSGVGITLQQMLFDGFFTRSEVSRLGYARLVRFYELLDASESTSLAAMQAYADVAKESELVKETEENYVEHKLITQLIEQRVSSGVSRGADNEQATGRLALAESNLITEISNLHDVSARYLRVIGDAPPKTLPPLPENLKFAGLPGSTVDAIKTGLPTNPAINAAFENVRASRMQIETAKAGYYPRLYLRAGSTHDRNRAAILGTTRDDYIELALNWNLYRGGADEARQKQAVELRYQARDLQEKACRDARQTLGIAVNDYLRLTEQLKYLDEHRLSTEKLRQAYRQQFEIGQRTLLDLLNTQNEYFEANRAYISARYNHIMAQARALAAMGRLTGTLGVTRPDQPIATDIGQDRGVLPAEELCPFDAPAMLAVDKARLVPPMPAPKKAYRAVTLKADAMFDFDKSELKPEGRKSIEMLLDGLEVKNVSAAIAIGHTDSKGSDDYNMALSNRRAESVKAFMVSKGVAADKISTEGKGESEPVASNETDAGRAKNRRVEIRITSGK
jgi:adhesin transport system outer membrane protein